MILSKLYLIELIEVIIFTKIYLYRLRINSELLKVKIFNSLDNSQLEFFIFTN